MTSAFLALALCAAGQISDTINIRDHGAKGDGLTDDTAAIQAALSAGAGKGVFIPAGTYIVTPSAARWLAFSSNTVIEGAGEASIIKVKDQAGSYGALFAPSSFVAAVSNVTFRNFVIDQNVQNVAGQVDLTNADTTGQSAILAFNPNHVRVEKMRFRNVGGIQTVYLNGNDVTVEGCHFSWVRARSITGARYDNTTVYVNATLHSIVNNRFETSDAWATTAIESHQGPGTVAQNAVLGYEAGIIAASADPGAYHPASNDITVSANSIQGCRDGIKLAAFTGGSPAHGQSLRGVTVVGNTISVANADRLAGQYVGIGLEYIPAAFYDGSFDAITIRGNTIRFQDESRVMANPEYAGGILAFPTGNVTNLSIEGNVIENCPVMGIAIGNNGGLPSTMQNVRVAGNILYDAGNNGAVTSQYRAALSTYSTASGSVKDLVFEGNQVLDTAAGGRPRGVNAWAFMHNGGERIRIKTNTITQVAGLPLGTVNPGARGLIKDGARGTWQPSDGSGAGLSLEIDWAHYARATGIVIVHGAVTYPVTADRATANVAGLPFAANDSGARFMGGPVSYTNYPGGLQMLVEGGSVRFYSMAGAEITNADLSGRIIRFTAIYSTDG